MKKLFEKIKKLKGFTLIELLSVIVVLTIILLIAMPTVLNIINDVKKTAFEANIKGIIKSVENNYYAGIIKKANIDNVYEFEDGTLVSSLPLDYKGSFPSSGKIIVNEQGEISLVISDGTWCAFTDVNNNILFDEIEKNDCLDKLSLISGEPTFVDLKGNNEPVLLDGMTPVKWDINNNEIMTTSDDEGWYDYSEKKWANAKSEDGSYWVWIPRYSYKIEDGYNSNLAGEISVKFLKNESNQASDESIVDNIPEYTLNEQTNYVKHPAFTFDNKELSGIWVAKYQASNSENLSYNPNHLIEGAYNYTNLVEGKEYFLGYSSWLGAWYLGTIEPLEPDYDCTFYANKRTLSSVSDYNRIYVTCDVPYKFSTYSTSNYAGNGLVPSLSNWYLWYPERIVTPGTLSSIMTHTNTYMYFSAAKYTSDIYWVEYDTTIPTTDFASSSNSIIYNDNNNGYIKSVPNVTSWRGMSLKNVFAKTKEMENNNLYGWNGAIEPLNIHPMKNDEWGAVAYLTHSVYGINDRVWNNPSNDYRTGCAGATATANITVGCLNEYDSFEGTQTSTTGNIYGIYDMVGSAREYAMASFNNELGMSGFTNLSSIEKYYNQYNGYSSNYFGDSLYETSSLNTGFNSWFSGSSNMIDTTSPWLLRGGLNSDSSNSSIFSYQKGNGAGLLNNFSFRPVIINKN